MVKRVKRVANKEAEKIRKELGKEKENLKYSFRALQEYKEFCKDVMPEDRIKTKVDVSRFFDNSLYYLRKFIIQNKPHDGVMTVIEYQRLRAMMIQDVLDSEEFEEAEIKAIKGYKKKMNEPSRMIGFIPALMKSGLFVKELATKTVSRPTMSLISRLLPNLVVLVQAVREGNDLSATASIISMLQNLTDDNVS